VCFSWLVGKIKNQFPSSWLNNSQLTQLDPRARWRHSHVETCRKFRQYGRFHALRYTVKILCWRAIDAVVAISLHFHTEKRVQNKFLLFWRYHVLDSRKLFQNFRKKNVVFIFRVKLKALWHFETLAFTGPTAQCQRVVSSEKALWEPQISPLHLRSAGCHFYT